VHRAFVASQGGTIRREHLPPRMLASTQQRDEPRNLDAISPPRLYAQDLPTRPAPVLDRETMERTHLIQALQQSNGRVDEAARMLGIGRTTLYRKRKKYGLL